MTIYKEQTTQSNHQRKKFLLGGFLIISAIIYLIASTTQNTSKYYYTVDELVVEQTAAIGENVRISGAVIGDSISYDADNLTLDFTVAHVPGDSDEIVAKGGLARVLHEAIAHPNQARLRISYQGPMPDLLRDEAQAIMDGHLNEDNIFVADTLLLKCPTKYEDELPNQTNN